MGRRQMPLTLFPKRPHVPWDSVQRGFVCFLLGGLGCTPATVPVEPSTHLAELNALLAFEESRRQATDFTEPDRSQAVFGADPSHLLPWDEDRLAGLLRGRSELVVLDDRFLTLARFEAPQKPSDLRGTPDGLWASGLETGALYRFALQPNKTLSKGQKTVLPGIPGVRALGYGPPGVLYVADAPPGGLWVVPVIRGRPKVHGMAKFGQCARPEQLKRIGRLLIVNCLYDHALRIYRVDAAGVPKENPTEIRHKGPFWAFDAVLQKGRLWIAAAGVENRDLDRTDGAFGHIDSFLWLYGFDTASEDTRLEATINLSQHGVVTPKSVQFSPQDPTSVHVFAYGSPLGVHVKRLTSAARDPRTGPPEVRPFSAPPGTRFTAPFRGGYVAANPLLDAWVAFPAEGGFRSLSTHDREGSLLPWKERLGEALFFTTLMAPHNRSEGRRSRFTCETCHFEGEIDGRTHHTGRARVYATTKPLRGLFNNRPYFSRALDRSMAKMVHNEFRVANKRNGHNPWFDLAPANHPWLKALGVPAEERLTPTTLRQSLMRFLMAFRHHPNPEAKTPWTAEVSRGARLFLRHCETCHQARLVADDPRTRVPYGRWKALMATPGDAIVWASNDYRQTGVVPYVHPKGARVPSLRRTRNKVPYFTNGKAKRLEDVLERARLGPDPLFLHDSGHPHTPAYTTGRTLKGAEKRALLAFLRRL